MGLIYLVITSSFEGFYFKSSIELSNVSSRNIFCFRSGYKISRDYFHHAGFISVFFEKSEIFNIYVEGYYKYFTNKFELRAGAQPLLFLKTNYTFFSKGVFKSIYNKYLLPYPFIDWGIVVYNKFVIPFYIGIMDGMNTDTSFIDAIDIKDINGHAALCSGMELNIRSLSFSSVFYYSRRDSVNQYLLAYLNLKTKIKNLTITGDYIGTFPYTRMPFDSLFIVTVSRIPIAEYYYDKINPDSWGYGYSFRLKYNYSQNVVYGGAIEFMKGERIEPSLKLSLYSLFYFNDGRIAPYLSVYSEKILNEVFYGAVSGINISF